MGGADYIDNCWENMKRGLIILATLINLAALTWFWRGTVANSKRTLINNERYHRLEAQNKVLRNERDSLKVVIDALRGEVLLHLAVVDSLQGCIDVNLVEITKNRIKYENKIVVIGNMSVDSLFGFFTGYIREYE